MLLIDKIFRRQDGESRHYSTLLVSLIILFFSYPIVHHLGFSRFWSFLFVAELLFAVYAISEGKRSLIVAGILVTPAILGEVSFFILETKETHWFSVFSGVIFLSYVILVIYRTSVFGKGRMTADRTAGAIAVYLLVGLLWGLVYGLVAATDPAAFRGLEAFSLEEPGAQQDFIYFSFVTLTSLGYGDVLPVSNLAKTLAWFEAIFGQLFLAVTIARLISLEIAHREHPPVDS